MDGVTGSNMKIGVEQMQTFDNKNSDRDCFITLKRWLENRNQNKTFIQYFKQYGYKKIAIYGAGDLGKLLYEEIKSSEIEVGYFVDRNAEGLMKIDNIPVVSIPKIREMKQVGVLIITPIGNYDEICQVLAEMVPELPTMSLREAVYEF